MMSQLSCVGAAMLACACATAGVGPSVSAANETTTASVHFLNDLDGCVKLTAGDVEKVHNLLLVSTQLQVLQSIGECGCKSAVMSYRARLNGRPASSADIIGRINTLVRQTPDAAEAVYLVLASDAALAPRTESVSVDVTCAAPD